MYIKWLKHPNDPTKNNTNEHVARSVAEVAVAFGQAEITKRPNYGTPEWLEERRAAAAKVTGPGPGDVVGSQMGVVEWGILQMKSGRVSVVKKVNGETFFMDGCTPDCPPSIRRQFEDACLTNPEANANALAAAKQAQFTRDADDKQAGRVQIMSAMFGSKAV